MAESKKNLSSSSPSNWHSLNSEAVFAALRTRAEGLDQTEAEARLATHGPNRLRPPKKLGPLRRLLLQFHNVLIYVLLAAAAMTAALAHWVDTGVIIGVIIINALIGFIQEGKAEKALDAIRTMLSQQAAVRRNGHTRVIPAEQLVPGDIVFLQSGDKVPADMRLFTLKSLRIEEAILTGESVPVEKNTAPAAPEAMLGDRKCLAFSGTLVNYGQGWGIVTGTGDHTEIGRISTLLREVETLTTPLLRNMARFSQWLSAGILLLATLTFLFGVLFRHYSAAEMFLAAVGLAVAAIPEGLPAIMTITLALGVQRMARRKAIVRRLPAVETLGSVTVICSDKTGTLTRNEMTVQRIATATGVFDVSGAGYDPHGDFSCEGDIVAAENYPAMMELLRAGALCNDATLNAVDGHWQLSGDPTEGALLTAAMKAGMDPRHEQQAWPRTDVIPFESEHRFMASLHHDHAGHGFVYLKGAPERLLSMCSRQRIRGEDLPLDEIYWQSLMQEFARDGLRLLALGFKPTDEQHRELQFSDLETGLTLLGLVGIIDPPREEAITAVRDCRSAGIRVKMITGDHAVTAMSIGEKLGIGDGKAVLTGVDLDGLDDSALRQRVAGVDIYARTSPEHKLRLVTALQSQGEVVAMTGDGVNDAPALKRADVGIAMGRNGTEAAKEAAEMVLADDNFASIAHAVEEGRTVYDNLKKAILFILPTNGGEALMLIIAILMGSTLPITPVQILWVNMITAVTLALALAFEPPEAQVMRRPPRDPKEALLSPMLVWRIVFVSLIIVSGAFGLFLWESAQGSDIATARTVAVNTLVMFEIFYLWNARYLLASVLNLEGLIGNRYVLIAIGVLLIFQMIFTYWGPAQTLFGTADLSAATWLRIVAVASTVLILVEVEKALIRRRHHRAAHAR